MRYRSIGRCIYCGDSAAPRNQEHIIPFAIAGDALVFDDASCDRCAREINKFEQPILRRMLGPFRVVANAPTRNKRDRPRTLPLKIGMADEHGRLLAPPETLQIPSKEMHLVLVGWRLPQPGILFEEAPPRDQLRGQPWCRIDWTTAQKHVDRYRDVTGWRGNIAVKIGDVPHVAYLRWLAKIAHGYAVAEWGFDGFTHFLTDIILGRSNHFCHYIGGDQVVPEPGETDAIYNIRSGRLVGDDKTLLAVELHLFPFYGAPIHHVIVGARERTSDEVALRQQEGNDM